MLIFDQKQPFWNQKPHENRFLIKIEWKSKKHFGKSGYFP